MICINCNNEHNSNFCPNCGEKSTVPKITFATIFNDAIATITHMDKGFLFNVKHLFLNPRKVITDYILGKRKDIFNPISFLIITISIYLIIESLIGFPDEKREVESKAFSIGYETGKFIFDYFKYFWLLSIIWLSLSTKLIFSKYSYAEHLAINSFVIGQATLVGLIGFALFKLPVLLDPVIYILIISMIYRIFKTKNKDFLTFFQSVGVAILFFIQLIVISVLITIIRTQI